MNNNALLLLGLGAAALYFMNRQAAGTAPGSAAAQWAAQIARQQGQITPAQYAQLAQQAPALLQNLIYYPYNQSPAGSPTPQSGTQMAWPTSASPSPYTYA